MCILTKDNNTHVVGYYNNMEKKVYLGYSPKSKNIEKLQKYVKEILEKKTVVAKDRSVKKNSVLKNKRF